MKKKIIPISLIAFMIISAMFCVVTLSANGNLEDTEMKGISVEIQNMKEENASSITANQTEHTIANLSDGRQLTDWEYRIENETIILTKYIGAENDVIIPAILDDKQVFIEVKAITGSVDFFGAKRRSELTSIKIGEEHNKVRCNNNSLERLFAGCTNLKTIDLSGLDTSNIINMESLFSDCTNLSFINFTKFDTSNVRNMTWMFKGCSLIKVINIENFNTSSVTSMSGMFFDCKNLEQLDIRNFETDNVIDFSQMFLGCEKIVYVDVSNFNTKSAENMMQMFADCKALEKVDVSKFETSQVKNMQTMFVNCYQLKFLDVTNFDTSNVTSIGGMFSNCKMLQNLDLSNFNLNKVTSLGELMFKNEALTFIDLKDWKNIGSNDLYFFNNFLITDQMNLPTIIVNDDYTLHNNISRGINALKNRIKAQFNYDANGGLFSDGSNNIEMFDDIFVSTNMNLKPTQKYIVNLHKPTRVGYTFTGWYTDKECKQKILETEDILDLTKTENMNLTLYAGWQINEKPVIHATDIKIELNKPFNPLTNVKATDKEDGEIKLTEVNIIANDVNINEVGTYHITYDVSDSDGNKVSKTITVIVEEKKGDETIEFKDFEHNNKDGKLTIEEIFKKGNISVQDKKGNKIKNSDLSYEQSELYKLNEAIINNEAGKYAIKFTTQSGRSFIITITTKKYTTSIIVETDTEENSGNGMDYSNIVETDTEENLGNGMDYSNRVNTFDTTEHRYLFLFMILSGGIGIIYCINKKMKKI